jgi:hypothetical protein
MSGNIFHRGPQSVVFVDNLNIRKIPLFGILQIKYNPNGRSGQNETCPADENLKVFRLGGML